MSTLYYKSGCTLLGHMCVVDTACTVIGQLDGLLETILTCTLQSPQYVSTVSRFDLIILVCCAIVVNENYN